jgi:hypothetical protein
VHPPARQINVSAVVEPDGAVRRCIAHLMTGVVA